LSESDVIGRLKDLMPYIIAGVIMVCVTVLRYGNAITLEDFKLYFGLVTGYVFGEVTGTIRFKRMKKMLNELER
jgi:xanthine/uracil permease